MNGLVGMMINKSGYLSHVYHTHTWSNISTCRNTPRKARPEGGDFKQTTLHMRHEMLVCSADDFLKTLAPFEPSDEWIERAFDCLEKKELLRTSAKKTSTATVSNRRNTKNSARPRARATPEVGAAEPDFTTTVCVPSYSRIRC